MRKFFSVALIAAAGMISSAAEADVHWYVAGTFSDGATISGSFDMDQYGVLRRENIVTTDRPGFPGMTYTPATVSFNNTTTSATFDYNGYIDEMQLYFASDLNVGVPTNALLTSSKECRDNYCSTNGSGALRYIVSGLASIDPISNVPEPASWALMIAGFGLTGAAMRRAKVRTINHAA